jgi:two-component system response regulator HydG
MMKHVREMLGSAQSMEQVYRLIGKLAPKESPVLITGETGTGKELVARAIHAESNRRGGLFIVVDCGAIPPNLVESELFGYVAGAFTGAVRAKEGLFQAAHGGTVFLDEIGELPLELQPKLLRVLQEGEIRPIGSTKAVSVDIRILAATHRDLEAQVKAGNFREDLYYRLAVLPLRVPPLRERREDIAMLARHFAERAAGPSFDATILPEAMELLVRYDWPGNVRELENAIERAVALNTNGPIRKEDLPTAVQSFAGAAAMNSNGAVSMADAERHAIEHALRRANNKKLEAARMLGIGKTTLYRKLKVYGLEEERGNSRH